MNSFIFLSLVLIVADQVSKYFIPGIKNYGGVFGILQGGNMLFIFGGFLVLVFIIYYKNKVKGYGYCGLILLFSSIIGNLIDRIFLGYVRDFIDLRFWPVFNLADSYSTLGVFLLILYFWKK